MTAADMPQSYWITLKDPKKFEGVTSAVVGLDGVSQIRDLRETLKPLYEWLGALKYGSWGIAGFLLLAALLLVANTIRLAAFARRKEIAIMRLVGASTLYIALPFLLEALVTAAIGVALAGGALGAFMYFGVHERIADSISFMPWIGMQDYTTALGRHRDPRAAADAASDTPADPQIPQSLIVAPLRSGCHTSPSSHTQSLPRPIGTTCATSPARSAGLCWADA